MGIDGIFNLIRPILSKMHISSFSGKTIAIDAMSWLYKGCYGCSYELNMQIETSRFLNYIVKMISLLRFYNIKRNNKLNNLNRKRDFFRNFIIFLEKLLKKRMHFFVY